jgi:RNA polymerase sigma-70 factor (ECF subfamily)
VNNPLGNNSSDKHLVDRVLQGDTRAFGLIIKNTEALVAQIVFKMIPVPEDRKDLAQDVYLKAFHNLPGFRFQCKLSTWIAQIAYNSCLSWLEKKRPVPAADVQGEILAFETTAAEPVTGNETESRFFRKELSGILREEIGRLPVIYRTLIVLFHHEFMSYEELSQVTGLPDGTVKSYLFRARILLRKNLLSKYKKEAL